MVSPCLYSLSATPVHCINNKAKPTQPGWLQAVTYQRQKHHNWSYSLYIKALWGCKVQPSQCGMCVLTSQDCFLGSRP